MTDRMYRAVLGFLLLLGLTIDLNELLYLLIIILFFEGITNQTIPIIVSRIRASFGDEMGRYQYTPEPANASYRFDMKTERVWRLLVGGLLAVTFYHFEQLWFFPWFMGFAIFGAGLSGLCPMLLAIKWVGFK